MQAQAQKMKGELLFEFKAKNNSTTIKDIGPNGVQLESASASRPTEPMTGS